VTQSDLYRKLTDVVKADADFGVDLAQRLVRIPTVNPKFEVGDDLNQEARLQNELQGVLQSLDFATEQSTPASLPGRPNLVGTWAGAQGRSLVLGGHIDVVPVGEAGKWTVAPFGGEIRSGRLYGRGALDMKGGLAAQVLACHAIRKVGIELEGALAIHAVVDEEAGGFGAIDLVNRTKASKAAIISEPTWGVINPCEGGLEWARVIIRGRNAHSATRYNSIYPQVHSANRLLPGVNALDYGALFLTALREFERDICINKFHPAMPPGMNTINAGVMVAGSGIGPDGRPTNLGNPAIIPDTCTIDLDIKFLPQESKETIRKEFEDFVFHFCQQYKWLQSNPIEIRWELAGLHFTPVNLPFDHPLVASLARSREQLGLETQIAGFIAVTDAAHYARAGTDCVIYGPAGDGFHGYDEYIEIDSLTAVAQVLACTVVDWCGHR
jgi:acetylornithine deacetylase/succinyl-diaminopimelate desuccinylase family protein